MSCSNGPGVVVTDDRAVSMPGLLGLDGLVTELARATDDYSGLPEVATRAVADLLQGTTVLWVVEPDARTIRLLAGWHPNAAARIDLAELGAGALFRRGEGFLGTLLESGHVFFRPSIETAELGPVHSGYLEYFARHGLTGMMIVPLVARGHRIGLLGLARHQGQESFVDADLALVQQVAGHLALAVDNARLLAMAREEVAERERSERRQRHAATHDGLTGLPNRTLLRERLEALLHDGGHPAPYEPALLFLDLDGFKDVNDGLGHEAGDAVLQQIARRLVARVPETGVLARLGGDEFAVLLEGDVEAVPTAAALRGVLTQPAWAGGQPVHLGGSIGIAYVQPHGERSADLMRRADLAMYRAKQTGEGVCVFDEERDGAQANRLARLLALRQGITSGDLRLHWQPIVDLASGEVCSAEALVRWQRGDELVPPDEFVPLAEASGLITALTDQVVTQAAGQAAGWRRPLPIAVNLATTVLADADSAVRYADRFRAFGVDPTAVTFEISEAGLLDARARRGLQAYAGQGFRLALDDFGTGYAAYAHLKDLPVDVVKIDRSFVTAVHTDPRDEAIVGSIAFVAQRLGLRTVAEGVEDAAALPLLHTLGVRAAQGFHLSRPLPAAGFERARDGWRGWAYRRD